ncbi:WD40 repeat domain-containing protein [Thermococcus gorgonarius]|uniref:WD40 repeat domain-containing protein n=1 Tax=Thermococcus gorgonarius TaxID=71997 RepID=A0A2Z2M6A4_THEGO|nr:WD40 repeat domain-containing protein [Thermococcus gorgonarius]ASJ00753.1 hypothetical protein A3K92_04290 [Thermococcus gorgonarius]
MKKLVTAVLALLFATVLIPVSAQPTWAWHYHDDCIVFSVAFNNNGDLGLGFGYYAIILNKNGERLLRAPVRGFAYSAALSDSDTLIIGTDGNWVQFFEPGKGLTAEYKTGDVVWAVDISPDGRYAVAGSGDGNVYFFENQKLKWKHDTGAFVWTVDLFGDKVLAGNDNGDLVALGLDGSELFSKHFDGQVRNVYGSKDMIVALILSSDESWSEVVALDWSGNELWGKHFDGKVMKIGFDGENVAVAGALDRIVLLDKNGNEVYSVPFFLEAFDVDTARGYTIVAGGDDALFIGPDGNVLWDYYPNETVERVAISKDARYLAVTHRVHGKEMCEGTVDFAILGGTSNPVETTTEKTGKRGLGNPLVAGGIILAVLIAGLFAWREMRE